MILTKLVASADELARETGWEVKPEGACKGEVCVPLPGSVRVEGGLDVTVLADALGMPLVRDAAQGLWVLGPETLNGRVLTTAVAPELELPDVNGEMFRLSSLRGQKVVMVAWASY